jgi:hypothetical protein
MHSTQLSHVAPLHSMHHHRHPRCPHSCARLPSRWTAVGRPSRVTATHCRVAAGGCRRSRCGRPCCRWSGQAEPGPVSRRPSLGWACGPRATTSTTPPRSLVSGPAAASPPLYCPAPNRPHPCAACPLLCPDVPASGTSLATFTCSRYFQGKNLRTRPWLQLLHPLAVSMLPPWPWPKHATRN